MVIWTYLRNRQYAYQNNNAYLPFKMIVLHYKKDAYIIVHGGKQFLVMDVGLWWIKSVGGTVCSMSCFRNLAPESSAFLDKINELVPETAEVTGITCLSAPSNRTAVYKVWQTKTLLIKDESSKFVNIERLW